MLNEMPIFEIPCHSPFFIDLGIIVTEVIEIGKVFFDEIFAFVWKLRQRNVTKLWVSNFFIHDRRDDKLILLNIIRTGLEIDTLGLDFEVNFYEID